ncbi:MAG: Asp-tRNA(Asn)/Glu-tRNA(Gln) amidotransferase subunit GatA [Gemmatimonadota bacterium]|nr:MAG: Asp-tRNA(Asn)/Glu-tRNA(Gln) amidotransferase subunit GatA [Gemmatimonadota bacterium]
MSIREIREALGAGSGAPDAALAALAKITRGESGDGSLNAFLCTVSEDALGEQVARAPTGPLVGVPVAVKDNLATSDLCTTCGSRILEGYISPYEATAVRRLREAGALVVGKTNMDEFAMGSSNENSAFGPVRNPVDRTRVPGGSSGGSAAAVAAGYVPVALGSDTGGSVRQPASLCGVVGVKPTYGRISRYGLVAFGSSLDQIGVLSRSVVDTAEVLGVISGHDPRDSTSSERDVPDLVGACSADVDGLVIGVPEEYFPDTLDVDVRGRCEAALERMAAAGATVRRVSLPHTRFAIPTYYVLATAEASSNLARYDGVRYGYRAPEAASAEAVYRRTRSSGFGAEVRRRIVLGTYALSSGYYDAYYGRAQRVRERIARDFSDVFAGGVDVLFTPTSPTVAFPLGERAADPVSMYLSDVFTVTANLANLPAISVPVGEVGGLPVGGQFIGRAWGEATLLRAAAALERTMVGSS